MENRKNGFISVVVDSDETHKVVDNKNAYPLAHGFTLIELLVVVAIIAVLVSILLPALSSARSSANSALCMTHLRSIGLGVQQYAMDFNGYAPRAYAPSVPPKWWQFFLSDKTRGCNYLPMPATFYNSNSTEADVWVCPIAESDSLNRGVDYVTISYLRVGGTWWNPYFGASDWCKLDKVENPSKQMFVVDGIISSSDVYADGQGMKKGVAGSHSSGTSFHRAMYLNYLGSGLRDFSGCMGFLHNGKANVLFVDWHIEQVGENIITVPNAFYDPDL